MLRLVSSLLAIVVCLSSIPALAEDPPPRAEPPPLPQAAPPPFYGPLRRPIPSEPRSRSAATGGIILFSGGITGLILGTQLYLAATDGCTPSVSFSGAPPPSFSSCSDEVGQIAGMSLLVGSALFTAGGLGLWIYGADEVPKSPRERAADARPMLVLGPRGAAVRFSF